MKHLFIMNPVAGGLRSSLSEVREKIAKYMDECGADYEIYITEAPMDAAEKVKRESIKGDELRVYACGGDGTLSECVHGAAGYKNTSVTHYPCGTGNDFIKTFDGDVELFRDIERLVNGDTAPLDIMDVNGRKCLNIASVGIDARVGADVHKYSHPPLITGKTAYALSLVANLFKGINRSFDISDGEGHSFSGKFALSCICNGRYYGGGFNPTKTALPDDGLLDILVVKSVSLPTLAVLLGKYASGQYYKLPKYITFFQGKKLTITSEKQFIVNVDGETLPTNKADIRLINGGVNFIFPMGSRYFETKQMLSKDTERKTTI